MKKLQKGFTLVELLISVSLLAIVSLVSVNIIVSLLRSSVKAQMAIDIEQASSFVFLKMENDIKKSYNAETSPSGKTLTLYQGSPVSPVTMTYKIAFGASDCSGANMGCVLLNTIKLTDDTLVDEKPTLFAVSVDSASSGFTLVTASGKTTAVNITIKFVKPNNSGAKMFNAETTLDTTVVLRGSY